MHRLAIIAALGLAGAGDWHYSTEADPLGQTVHVAEVAPDGERPFVSLKLMCGGIAGIVLQINIGQMQYAAMAPRSAGLDFEVDGRRFATAAEPAAIADGIGTYEIKGSEAGQIARLLMQGSAVKVRQGGAEQIFPLSGAATAIGEVMASCPFKI